MLCNVMLASQEGPYIRAPGKKELPSSSIGILQIPVSKLWVDFHRSIEKFLHTKRMTAWSVCLLFFNILFLFFIVISYFFYHIF